MVARTGFNIRYSGVRYFKQNSLLKLKAVVIEFVVQVLGLPVDTLVIPRRCWKNNYIDVNSKYLGALPHTISRV